MTPEGSPAEMREIKRVIVSALIFSKDGKILMGRKDPAQGGVYSDCWHIPGGGVDDGETLEQALRRELEEEVGIDISSYHVEPFPGKGMGVAEKTLKDTGERVLVKMEFNRFKIVLDKLAGEIPLTLSDDLVKTQWFSKDELSHVKQIPGGKEFFQKIGLISEK